MGSLLSCGGSGPAQNIPAAWAYMYDDFQSYALTSRLKILLLLPTINAFANYSQRFAATEVSSTF
jgi:hypothetical protein